MADLSDKIKAKIENIDRLFLEMPAHKNLANLSTLELAGVATLLHNFYNGVENIFKQILVSKRVTLFESGSWHKDLLNLAVSKKMISESIKKQLMEYLAFRHFFLMLML